MGEDPGPRGERTTGPQDHGTTGPWDHGTTGLRDYGTRPSTINQRPSTNQHLLPAVSTAGSVGRVAFSGGPARGGDGRAVRWDCSSLQDLQHPRCGCAGPLPRSTTE